MRLFPMYIGVSCCLRTLTVLTILPILSTAGFAQGNYNVPVAGPPPAIVPPGQEFEEEIIPQRYVGNPQVESFIEDMAAHYGFNADALRVLFSRVSYSASAVKLVMPSTAPSQKDWRVYQSNFINPLRINAGVKFWLDNRAALQTVSLNTGVPPEIIVGILGVETIYGRHMGNFHVLDVLTTFTFNYPNVPNRASREAIFRQNLTDFLLWTRSAKINPMNVLGSYAGAIGYPQFMPSSILQYGVSFKGNRAPDLRINPADAIASVANYLKQQGWQAGRPVEWRIASDSVSQGIAQAAADGQPLPRWQLGRLQKAGLKLDEPDVQGAAERNTPVLIVDLPSAQQPTRYLLGLQNFYVLTRYNRSFFYAQAVYELGETIAARLRAQRNVSARVAVMSTAHR